MTAAFPSYGLVLADGGRLMLCAADPPARRIVDFWAEKANLKPIAPGEPPPGTFASEGISSSVPRRLLAVTGELRESPDKARPELRLPDSFAAGPGDIVCPLEPPGALKRVRRIEIVRSRKSGVEAAPIPLTEEEWFWQQLARISACIGRSVQPRGGALVHSGLGAYLTGPDSELRGFLMAGRSGVGKSTAGRRLPAPWVSLADDMTLLVRPPDGIFQAHPFPTWSRFFGLEAGDGYDTWDSQRAVPLRAVFVLEQVEIDQVEPLGPGHALILLVELAGQASARLMSGYSLEQSTAFNQQRFDNLCALVKNIPAFLLHVSLNGTFWEDIGRMLS